jgi:hypothetical protein
MPNGISVRRPRRKAHGTGLPIGEELAATDRVYVVDSHGSLRVLRYEKANKEG